MDVIYYTLTSPQIVIDIQSEMGNNVTGHWARKLLLVCLLCYWVVLLNFFYYNEIVFRYFSRSEMFYLLINIQCHLKAWVTVFELIIIIIISSPLQKKSISQRSLSTRLMLVHNITLKLMLKIHLASTFHLFRFHQKILRCCSISMAVLLWMCTITAIRILSTVLISLIHNARDLSFHFQHSAFPYSL